MGAIYWVASPLWVIDVRGSKREYVEKGSAWSAIGG